MKSPHPHVAWRLGRPRFSPAANLRALGHKAMDLKHDDGAWFTFGEACDWARRFAAALRAAPGQKPRGRPAAGQQPRLSFGKLVEEWQLSQRWTSQSPRGRKPLAKNTLRDYRQKLKVLADDHPVLWAAPAAAVSVPIMQKVYDAIEEKRGLHTARGVVAVVSAAYKWAITRGRVTGHNPAHGLDKAVPAPRIRVASRAEIAALIAAADALGLPQVGDAIVAGLWTGQRQGDRLAMLAHARDAGRRIFRQSKTGAIVAIRETPELEARLAAARARRLAAGVVDPHVILNEATWRPYVADTYRHDFARVRGKAALACPSVATLRDQDLRDTAVTWMAQGGATIPEIAAVTGHAPETAHAIMRHYLARHPEMADSGLGKMLAWYDANGQTETGL